MNDKSAPREEFPLSGKILFGCVIAGTVIAAIFLFFKFLDFVHSMVEGFRLPY